MSAYLTTAALDRARGFIGHRIATSGETPERRAAERVLDALVRGDAAGAAQRLGLAPIGTAAELDAARRFAREDEAGGLAAAEAIERLLAGDPPPALAQPGPEVAAPQPAPDGWVSIDSDDWTDMHPEAAATHADDWRGRHGFVPDDGATDAWGMHVDQGGAHMASQRHALPPGTVEAELRYRILLPEGQERVWGAQDSNIKLPGLAGPVSAENGGYGGSRDTPLAHAMRAPSARQMLGRPGTGYDEYALGMELYGGFSENRSDDPGEHGRKYGETRWYSSSGSSPNGARCLTPGRWAEVGVHVRVNTPGRADGLIRTTLDGEPGYEREGLRWTDNEGLAHLAWVWFNVYHGGSRKRTAGRLHLLLSGFAYRVLGGGL